MVYDVEVPTYLRVRMEADSELAARQGAEAFVEELSTSVTPHQRMPVRPDAAVLETQLLTLDDTDDNVPDVYPVTLMEA